MPAPLPPLAGRRALFVSWVTHHGRSEDLARELGAECAFVAVGTLRNRRTAPARHAWQALVTTWLLLARRPRVLVVMAPPAPLVLLGLLWSRLTRSRLIVDCHSGAVLGRPLSGRLAAHADLVLVTLPQLAAQFPRAVPVHDPPVHLPPAPRHDEVVFPASWLPDEPLEDLLAAARALPETRFAITGTPRTNPVLSPNVRLTGYLDLDDYRDLLAGAPAVLALTTREDTMQRAAYEAIGAGRPVIASDTTALRAYLGDSATYAGDLTQAISDALSRLPELERAAEAVRLEQQRAFDDALERIASVLA